MQRFVMCCLVLLAGVCFILLGVEEDKTSFYFLSLPSASNKLVQTADIAAGGHDPHQQIDAQGDDVDTVLKERHAAYMHEVEKIDVLSAYDHVSLQDFFAQIGDIQDAFFSEQEIMHLFGEQRRVAELVLLQTQLREAEIGTVDRQKVLQQWVEAQPEHWQQVYRDKLSLQALNEMSHQSDFIEQAQSQFGSQVTQRIEQLQEKRSEFRERFRAFKALYDAVPLDFVDTQLIDQERVWLLEQYFLPHERLRVDALLRHQQQP